MSFTKLDMNDNSQVEGRACVIIYNIGGKELKSIKGYASLLGVRDQIVLYPKNADTVVKDIKRNPKRMQREAKKQMQETGIGTKSQQALKLQQEQNKQERKVRSREKKEAHELRMFELKQQKKREKHRGH